MQTPHFGTTIAKREHARKTLPPGHYGLADADEAVRREYAQCRELEARLIKAILRRKQDPYITWEQAIALICHLDLYFKYRPCRLGVESMAGASAFYRRRTIYFPYNGRVWLRTLLHEYAHHMQDQEHMTMLHGDGFCLCEEMVFGAIAENRHWLP